MRQNTNVTTCEKKWDHSTSFGVKSTANRILYCILELEKKQNGENEIKREDSHAVLVNALANALSYTIVYDAYLKQSVDEKDRFRLQIAKHLHSVLEKPLTSSNLFTKAIGDLNTSCRVLNGLEKEILIAIQLNAFSYLAMFEWHVTRRIADSMMENVNPSYVRGICYFSLPPRDWIVHIIPQIIDFKNLYKLGEEKQKEFLTYLGASVKEFLLFHPSCSNLFCFLVVKFFWNLT